MQIWTDLRDLHPEYFEDLVVMQQPCANADEIIVGWGLEDLQQRFPAILLQRDLVSGALSSRDRMAAHLSQCVCCWIGPNMTPATQVTDTDVAFPFKAKLRREKERLEQFAKAQALKQGVEVSFTIGPWELLQVLAPAIREFKAQADAEQLVLKALRRNGQLACYPTMASSSACMRRSALGWAH